MSTHKDLINLYTLCISSKRQYKFKILIFFVNKQTYNYFSELKDGRIPEGVTKRIGYWKAEEFQKFAYPVSEYVIGDLLPEVHYHVWITLVRITEMIYNTGRNGMHQTDIMLLEKLILRHNVLTEEAEGMKSCVVTLHNLLHLPDDILRFSTADNYWCYTFERAAKSYVERSSNSKNLEYTFAHAESRREFLKFQSNISRDRSEATFMIAW